MVTYDFWYDYAEEVAVAASCKNGLISVQFIPGWFDDPSHSFSYLCHHGLLRRSDTCDSNGSATHRVRYRRSRASRACMAGIQDIQG